MKDYTKQLPAHTDRYIGEKDLFLQIFPAEGKSKETVGRPPILFVHGAYTGSWMWSKYLPHFVSSGWCCYAMNLRSHYKSRVMDMSNITFEDYLEDIKEVMEEIGEPPIVVGFSLGGILCQKIAVTEKLAGLILIDSSISKEVNEAVPYEELYEGFPGMIAPAPVRDITSVDESEEDILFQVKYLSMESSKALTECGCWIKGVKGISIDSSRITCPVLIIKAVNSEEDDHRGRAEAEHLHGSYNGFWNTTHTGLLMGQRYMEVTDRITEWLRQFLCVDNIH
jgi:pimeloyl-ACP methyl ester carboxylesterase